MGRVSKRKASMETGLENAAGAGKKNGKKYRAGIYARLSSDMDADKNESVDVQISIAKNFVEEFNRKQDERIEIVECYSDDGWSGSGMDRPGMNGCLTVELKKNFCRPHQACIFLSNFLF